MWASEVGDLSVTIAPCAARSRPRGARFGSRSPRSLRCALSPHRSTLCRCSQTGDYWGYGRPQPVALPSRALALAPSSYRPRATCPSPTDCCLHQHRTCVGLLPVDCCRLWDCCLHRHRRSVTSRPGGARRRQAQGQALSLSLSLALASIDRRALSSPTATMASPSPVAQHGHLPQPQRSWASRVLPRPSPFSAWHCTSPGRSWSRRRPGEWP